MGNDAVSAPELLRQFLDENKITQATAAAALGVQRPVISLWLNGHSVPQLKRRRDIAIWTGGKVTEEAWESAADAPTVTPFIQDHSEPQEPGGAPAATFPAGGLPAAAGVAPRG
jgi:transcriptional regulator with XRE-family HTH domain